MDTEERTDEYILAIDPALSTTGYAIIHKDTGELMYINKFTTSPKYSLDDRIDKIVTKLFGMTAQYNIKDIVLEDGFSGNNLGTGLKLASLRGAIIEVFRFCKYNVCHMLPTQIRKHLGVGGNAKKEDVAKAIIEMYPNNKKLAIIGPYSDKQNKDKTSDMYDAISIGVAYRMSLKDGGSNG